MKTLIVTTARIMKEDHSYFIDSGLKTTIDRYSAYFGEITLFGMDGSDKGKRSTGSVSLEGFNVKVMGNLRELMLGKEKRMLEEAIPQYDLVILRVPSVVCHIAAKIARKNRIPYFVEVIGDAFGALWYHSLSGKLLAVPSMIKTKMTIKNANYALYVSRYYLQTKYPCKNRSVGISDCEFESPKDEYIEKRKKKINSKDYSSVVLMNAAAIDVKYKGQEYIIRAIPYLNSRGIVVKLYLVGNGDSTRLLNIAKKYGVDDQVVFTGGVSHDIVLQLLEETDIYIQPSLTEAFGRSIVEALSKGCMCIGSNTGGITELVQKEYLVPLKNPLMIAEKIIEYVNLPVAKKTELCQNNFEHAKDYDCEKLDKERAEYYKYVQEDCLLNSRKRVATL